MKDLLQTALTVITCLTIALLLTLFVLNSEAKADMYFNNATGAWENTMPTPNQYPVKAEVTEGYTAESYCNKTSGEYGYVMVEHCIKAEHKAVLEMDEWFQANSGNEVAEKIGDHCHATSMEYGWVMVQHCITAEVNAYNNINN